MPPCPCHPPRRSCRIPGCRTASAHHIGISRVVTAEVAQHRSVGIEPPADEFRSGVFGMVARGSGDQSFDVDVVGISQQTDHGFRIVRLVADVGEDNKLRPAFGDCIGTRCGRSACGMRRTNGKKCGACRAKYPLHTVTRYKLRMLSLTCNDLASRIAGGKGQPRRGEAMLHCNVIG